MDYKTAEEFKKHIVALSKQINFDSYMELIEDKIIDFAAKNPNADIQEIKAELKLVFPPEYDRFIDSSFSKYSDVVEILNELYPDLGDKISRNVQELRAIEKIDQIRYGEYGERSIKRLTKIVHDVLLEEPDRKKLSTLIKSGVKNQKIVFYANTIAWTQVKAFGRAGKSIKANIAEVFYYDYYGQRRETTRPKCIWALAKKTFHIDEIKEQDNDRWIGQIKPFLHYCGGWNCGHDLEPNPFIKIKK